MGNRELIALLNLSSWCLVMVERLFLTVPRGCLQFVIVVFPDHTHLLFLSVGFLLLPYQFYVLLGPNFCIIFFLYLNLYVLGDDAWISKGSFMQTKHLCVLIHM